MTVEVAIIADDLTGALDTSAPFVAAGYRVVAATRPGGLDAALAQGPEVVVVNTASRGLTPDVAAEVARNVALRLRRTQPSLVFKKIDSRLQGNVAAETAAIADVFEFAEIRVAAAVPEQGRITRDGAVIGRGVAKPINIAALFGGCDAAIEDAETDSDLDRVVERGDWSKTLAVGARGLGAAFARRRVGVPTAPFVPDRLTLFAIGSRDAITAQQIETLRSVEVHDAPRGVFAGKVQLPALLRCVGPDDTEAEQVARQFAVSTTGVLVDACPRVLVVSGGDTALAILDKLEISVVRLRGEAGGGLPWLTIGRSSGQQMTVVVKSGGFGDSGSLAALLPRADR